MGKRSKKTKAAAAEAKVSTNKKPLPAADKTAAASAAKKTTIKQNRTKEPEKSRCPTYYRVAILIAVSSIAAVILFPSICTSIEKSERASYRVLITEKGIDAAPEIRYVNDEKWTDADVEGKPSMVEKREQDSVDVALDLKEHDALLHERNVEGKDLSTDEEDISSTLDDAKSHQLDISNDENVDYKQEVGDEEWHSKDEQADLEDSSDDVPSEMSRGEFARADTSESRDDIFFNENIIDSTNLDSRSSEESDDAISQMDDSEEVQVVSDERQNEQENIIDSSISDDGKSATEGSEPFVKANEGDDRDIFDKSEPNVDESKPLEHDDDTRRMDISTEAHDNNRHIDDLENEHPLVEKTIDQSKDSHIPITKDTNKELTEEAEEKSFQSRQETVDVDNVDSDLDGNEDVANSESGKQETRPELRQDEIDEAPADQAQPHITENTVVDTLEVPNEDDSVSAIDEIHAESAEYAEQKEEDTGLDHDSEEENTDDKYSAKADGSQSDGGEEIDEDDDEEEDQDEDEDEDHESDETPETDNEVTTDNIQSDHALLMQSLKDDRDENYVEVSKGVRKRILKAGTGEKIDAGDIITIQCIGYLDEDPPKKFWSTKDPSQRPFTFAVGKRQVIKGWDEGALSMTLYERSRIKIEAKKAYGKFGFEAWGIPPGASIIFEMEVTEHKRMRKR